MGTPHEPDCAAAIGSGMADNATGDPLFVAGLCRPEYLDFADDTVSISDGFDRANHYGVHPAHAAGDLPVRTGAAAHRHGGDPIDY